MLITVTPHPRAHRGDTLGGQKDSGGGSVRQQLSLVSKTFDKFNLYLEMSSKYVMGLLRGVVVVKWFPMK